MNRARGQTGIRVQVAHAGRRVPRIFDMLEAGQLSVSSASMLAPRLEGLEQATTDALLDAASGLSKRAVEELLATRFSKPDVPDRIRRVPRPQTPAPTSEPLALLPPKTETAAPASAREVSAGRDVPVRPGPATGADPAATSTGRGLALAAAPPPARVEHVQPLAADRFKVQLTVSRQTRDKLDRVQAQSANCRVIRRGWASSRSSTRPSISCMTAVEEALRRRRAAAQEQDGQDDQQDRGAVQGELLGEVVWHGRARRRVRQ